ncbi:EAL domain-containing protein [Thaumasiovibrio sp. DFM-14]|uniref:EAL domain-containing protein n=1 Tax=Thaumasiovibrio sp. DFM-14 TaxID=3384792 RepID=UPI00399FCF0B
MTLNRQIFTWASGLLFLLTVIALGSSLYQVRLSFITQQQERTVDTAKQVSFALQSALSAKDIAAAETTLNAIFDNGYYNEIALRLLWNGEIITLTYQAQEISTPLWLSSLPLFNDFTYTETITSGWVQLGQITLVADAQPYYNLFWQKVIKFSVLHLALLFIFAIILFLTLRQKFKPLRYLAEQANNLLHNKQSNEIKRPKQEELITISHTLNHLVKQLKQHFETQVKEADKLRVRAYQDQISGLGNRSFLISQLESWSNSDESGGFALLCADLIEEAYHDKGYEEGDKLVVALAERLHKLAGADYITARLSQKEFAIVAPNISSEELNFLGKSMLHAIIAIQDSPLSATPPPGAVGLVFKSQPKTASTLLAEADNALAIARQTPLEPITLLSHHDAMNSLSKHEWHNLIDEAINQQLFMFKLQKACNRLGEPMHFEVFTSINKWNKTYTAKQFLGSVEQLKIGPRLDSHIIESVISQLNYDPTLGPVAINLTVSSICDTAFMHWLAKTMREHNALKERLLFELPEVVFVKHAPSAFLLCDIIHQNHFQFGIDNYGRHFSSLDYLNKLRPSYVKLDFAYTSELDNEKRSDVLASVSRTAMQLNITTIATHVETERQLEKLSDLFINGFQGYVFDHPEAAKTA